MKRWTLRILLCLILGAITTVAVAWGIATTVGQIEYPLVIDWRDYRDPRDGLGISIMVTGQGGWKQARFTFEGPASKDQHPVSFANVPRWAMPWAERNRTLPPSEKGIGEIEIHAYGFPREALLLTVLSTSRWITGSHLIATDDPPQFREAGEVPHNLPLRPILPGFLIDTAIYGVLWIPIWQFLSFGFARAKRFIRVKRGRCPMCGYDLRGNVQAGCSECGRGRDDSPRHTGLDERPQSTLSGKAAEDQAAEKLIGQPVWNANTTPELERTVKNDPARRKQLETAASALNIYLQDASEANLRSAQQAYSIFSNYPGNLLEFCLLVLKESKKENFEIQKYFLGQMEQRIKYNKALADYMEELVAAAAKLNEKVHCASNSNKDEQTTDVTVKTFTPENPQFNELGEPQAATEKRRTVDRTDLGNLIKDIDFQKAVAQNAIDKYKTHFQAWQEKNNQDDQGIATFLRTLKDLRTSVGLGARM